MNPERNLTTKQVFMKRLNIHNKGFVIIKELKFRTG